MAGETTQQREATTNRPAPTSSEPLVLPKNLFYLFLEQAFVIAWTKRIRTGYVICRAQFKIKMWGSLFNYYKEFQDGDSRALNQAWCHSKHGALCDCTGPIPVKLALKRMWQK